MSNGFSLPVSHEWLEKTLQTALGVTNKLEGFEQEPLTVGQGLMSYICRLKLKWSPTSVDGKAVVTSIIFKMPSSKPVESALNQSTGRQTEGNFDFIEVFHRSECLFYTHLRETDEDLKAMSPACYYSRPMQADRPGLLLIEDVPHGKVVEIMDGLNLDQIKAIVGQVGKLHGWSLQNDSWRGKLMEFRDIDAFRQMCVHSHEMLREKFPDIYKVSDDQFNSFFSAELFTMMFATEFAGRPLVKVMVHGDIWTTNCLFAYDQASGVCTNRLLSIIDWQNLHEGFGTEDIGRLVVSSCDVDTRRKHIGEILAVYYDSLKAKLAPTQPPFTLEDVHLYYRINLGFSALGYMFGVPILFGIAEKRGKAHLIPDLVRRADAGMQDGYAALKELGVISTNKL